MQHVFSLGSVFRASPFVNYHHQPSPTSMDGPAITPVPEPPKDLSPPPPPPPQQKLLIKLRVSDLGSKPRPSTSSSAAGDVDELVDDEDEAPPPVVTTKRRGGGAGTRGKRRKVDASGAPGTPTSDDGLSVAWDSSASTSGTPAKRGRGKGSRGGGTGRGRGGRKSGLQHQVLPVPIPGTPDSAGELSLRPASPSSESTSNALTPTPISTPTIPIPTSSLALPPVSSSLSTPAPLQPQPSTPAEIDPALLATAPRRPLPTRAFAVQAAPKTTQPALTVNGGAGGGMDLNRRKVRQWGMKMREVKGVGGGSWWVRTWVGSPESQYASDPARILSVPTTLPRSSTTAPKPRKTDSSRSIPTTSAPKIKVEVPAPPPMSAFGVSHYRDRDQEGVELLTAFASSSRKTEPEEGKGWGGIGAKHYREHADPSPLRDREKDREYYRGESSGASTPGVSVPTVKYDLARDGIEEVVPPPAVGEEDVKGKGREVVVNGKGKERERIREDDATPPIDGGVEGRSGVMPEPVETTEAGEGRTRSGSGYEQAARDVEMELMGES
ncbi:hypothetical protein FRC10_004852 [Ceratobasidium sp. 414]|nr:hypothetical protein FRC10_004852 [Ceratobasidium sp. 414]